MYFVFQIFSKVHLTPTSVTGGASRKLLYQYEKMVCPEEFCSNEAGLGTGSIAHACADTKKTGETGILRNL